MVRHLPLSGILIALLAGGRVVCAGSSTDADPLFKEAWNAVSIDSHSTGGHIAAQKGALLVKLNSDMDRFLLQKVIGYAPSPTVKGSTDDYDRIRSVLNANGAMGCIWLVAAQRRLDKQSLVGLVQMAPPEMMNYQEHIQFLVGLLRDPRGGFDGVSSVEPPPAEPVYEGRVCDRAYNILARHLKSIPEAVQAAQDIEGKDAFAPYTRYVPYGTRNLRIQHLLRVITTPKVVAAIQARPSALKELQQAGAWNPLANCAAAWLSRVEPEIMARSVLPKAPVSLMDALMDEYPAWSDAENQSVERLQDAKYSAHDLVIRLPQDVPRNRGMVELTLLRRPDRKRIAEALVVFFSDDESQDVRPHIIDVLGELARESDAASKQQTSAFLQSVAESAQQSWFLKQIAQDTLKRLKPAE
jgi:hypothetical protein